MVLLVGLIATTGLEVLGEGAATADCLLPDARLTAARGGNGFLNVF